jgi:hypothetical protein
MARCRNIKPAFFRNEILAAATPHARLLFIGLWTLADRRGLLEDRPARIRADVFPYETVDIEALLTELAATHDEDRSPAFVERYSVNGRRFIRIVNFARHQYPNAKEKADTTLLPPENTNKSAEHSADTVPEPCQHGSDTPVLPLNRITSPPPTVLPLGRDGTRPVAVVGMEF